MTPAHEYSLPRLVFLHLAPGAMFTVYLALAASALSARDIDPVFAFFGGIGFVLVPLELGYLAFRSHQTTGSWSPMAVVDYRHRLPIRRMLPLAAVLVLWFLVCLVFSILVIDEWIAEHVFGWMPDSLLQFATVEDSDDTLSRGALVAFLAIAFAFNGIAGPVTEELYFRGHLLPRMKRYGRWAPIGNTILFGIYHFFSPWRWPAIIIGFLPITWKTWQHRSIYLSIAAHVAINMITVLLILAAALAES